MISDYGLLVTTHLVLLLLLPMTSVPRLDHTLPEAVHPLPVNVGVFAGDSKLLFATALLGVLLDGVVFGLVPVLGAEPVGTARQLLSSCNLCRPKSSPSSHLVGSCAEPYLYSN